MLLFIAQIRLKDNAKIDNHQSKFAFIRIKP